MAVAAQLELGARVVASDGRYLGKVKEIRLDCFKVHRRFLPDYWLLNACVDHVSNGVVLMKLSKQALEYSIVDPLDGAA